MGINLTGQLQQVFAENKTSGGFTYDEENGELLDAPPAGMVGVGQGDGRDFDLLIGMINLNAALAVAAVAVHLVFEVAIGDTLYYRLHPLSVIQGLAGTMEAGSFGHLASEFPNSTGASPFPYGQRGADDDVEFENGLALAPQMIPGNAVGVVFDLSVDADDVTVDEGNSLATSVNVICARKSPAVVRET